MPVIELENITKSYLLSKDLNYVALKGINLTINKGEFVAIMGPSGSGKSTMMHIIGCLDKPTTGIYRLNGVDVSKLSDDQLSIIRNQQIGFVFQSFNLLPRLTLLENILLPFTYSQRRHTNINERGMEVLKLVGLESKKDNRPNQVSGGQVQRVAIARSLVMNPSIILADEPTGNLDSKTSHEIMDILKKLNDNGNTVILITHEEDIAKFAQRIIHIKDGQINDL